jgi:hypothetical protein
VSDYSPFPRAYAIEPRFRPKDGFIIARVSDILCPGGSAMKVRKAVGIGFVVLGILNIVDLGNPLIPTIGVQAVIVGGIFIAAGAYLMRPEAGARRGSLLRLGSLFSSLRSVKTEPRRRIDPLLPVRTLRLAEERGGELTVSAVAMALEICLDDAQDSLDELVRKGAASAEVDLDSGVATYRFPEFLSRGGESSDRP